MGTVECIWVKIHFPLKLIKVGTLVKYKYLKPVLVYSTRVTACCFYVVSSSRCSQEWVVFVVCWSRTSDLRSGCLSDMDCVANSSEQSQHCAAEPGLGHLSWQHRWTALQSCTQGSVWRTCFNRLFQDEGYLLSWWYLQTHPEPCRKPQNCFQLRLPQGYGSVTPNENIVLLDRPAQEYWTAACPHGSAGVCLYHIQMHLIFVVFTQSF